MDAVRNPYRPNAGSRPAELAGRGPQLEQFRILAARLKRGADEQSVIARGLRGVGKTVLLNAFEDQAENEGLLTYYHELTPESDLVAALARDIERALARLSLGERLSQAIRSSLGHMRTIRLAGPEGLSFEVDLRGAIEGTIAADLTDLMVEAGRVAAEKGTGLVFFLDELQFVEEVQYRAMISALHRANQRGLPIAVAGAGLPQIPQLSGEARSYAERLFAFQTISNLSTEAAASALIEPARSEGVEFEPEALEAAIEWSEGYPFFLQQIGKHAWNSAGDSPISLADVEGAIPAAREALDRSIYEVRLQRAAPGERRYMRAMSALGDGPYRTGRVAEELGQPLSALSRVRQELIDKGLIYATENYGEIAFSVPRFAEFLRRTPSP